MFVTESGVDVVSAVPAVTPSPVMDSEKQKSGKELEMAEANNNEGEKEEEVTVNKSFYLKLLEKSQMWQELQVTWCIT